MTSVELKQIITTKVPFKALKKNEGIVEFHEEGIISFGISYEDNDEGKECYIYNLFVDTDAYINISGQGTVEDPIPDDIVSELIEAFNKLQSAA